MENLERKDAFSKVLNVLLKICAYVCMGLLVAIFCVTVLQVFCRFVLGNALIWCEEFCRYCGIWLVMLSTAIAIEKRSHMSLDLITNKLSPVGQKVLLAFGDLLILVMSVYMCYASYGLCAKFYTTLSIALRWPMGIVYLGVVIGWGCSIITAAYNLVLTLISFKEGE